MKISHVRFVNFVVLGIAILIRDSHTGPWRRTGGTSEIDNKNHKKSTVNNHQNLTPKVSDFYANQCSMRIFYSANGTPGIQPLTSNVMHDLPLAIGTRRNEVSS